jgi:hypothetical protein
VEPFGHVEHQIRSGGGELLREELVGFETDDAAEETESLFHRSDGGGIVPLSERVVAAVVFSGGRGFGFFVVRETYSHVVSGDLLQKKAARAVCGSKRIVK